MSKAAFYLGISIFFLSSGCFLPHPDETSNGPVPSASAPAASRKEAAAIAAALRQVANQKRDYRIAPADLIAVTGDPLAQEPCCIYQPKHWDAQLESEAASFAVL